jgi:membrane-associated phospholipid phosphatase
MSRGFHTKRIKDIWWWVKNHILVILAPALLLGANRFFYLLARLISHNIYHSPASFLDVSLPGLDNGIKLNSTTAWFALPYISAYLYWLVMTFVVYHTLGPKNFWRLIGAVMVMNIICFIVWSFVPTKQNAEAYLQARQWIYGNIDPGGDKINPNLHGANKFNAVLLSSFYGIDSPDNLLPSGHNSCTFIIFMMYWFKDEKGKRNWIGFGLTLTYYLLIAASTLCTKQHCMMDIFAGIGVSLGSLFLSDFFKLGGRLEKWTIHLNISIVRSFVQIKGNKIYLLEFIAWILLWSCLIAFGIYFGLVSLFTGDPFKHLWYGDSNTWSAQAYFPRN